MRFITKIPTHIHLGTSHSHVHARNKFPGKRFSRKNDSVRLKSRFYVHISHLIAFKISNPHISSFLMAVFQVRSIVGKIKESMKIT